MTYKYSHLFMAFSYEVMLSSRLFIFFIVISGTLQLTGTRPYEQSSQDTCILPPQPKNGVYIVEEKLGIVYINVTCESGYKIDGNTSFTCQNGDWSSKSFPTCVRACKIPKSPKISYRCLISYGNKHTRECEELEMDEAVVVPKCNAPNYYSPAPLPLMFCIDGVWNYEPKCYTECGRQTPKAELLVLGGEEAEMGDVPWHAGLYRNDGAGYQYICGATLISENVLLSAAHCFYLNGYGKLPASRFAIGVGKLSSEWNNANDLYHEQKSPVKEILFADRFLGADLFFQEDIAIVIVERPFTLKPNIRPVCLDLDSVTYNSPIDIKNGTLGMVAGWGLTTRWTGSESPVLKLVNMPYVSYDECKRLMPEKYKKLLTYDKFCAGYQNGTVYKGDSGGGWVYPLIIDGVERQHLGGIVSTITHALYKDWEINKLTSFTDIFQHAMLIKKYWNK